MTTKVQQASNDACQLIEQYNHLLALYVGYYASAANPDTHMHALLERQLLQSYTTNAVMHTVQICTV
jgi:hypothetical protein